MNIPGTSRAALISSLHIKRVSLVLLAAVVAFSVWTIAIPTRVQAAACTPPASDLGSAAMSVSIPATGSYRIWSRIMVPDTTNNSYSLEIDGNNCFVVGDSQIAANTWTWVDYQNGSASNKINLSLNSGTRNLKLIGREAGVSVDRVIFASDTSCVPVGTGGNCTIDTDQSPPVVELTAPVTDATVSGNVDVTATATDTSGVTKAEFYVDGTLKQTVATAPYKYTWNTATVANGTHSLSVKAYDKVGNIGSDSTTVIVKNGDSEAPTAPSNLLATASSPTVVDLKWNASTDNVGVAGYWVQRDNVTLAQIGNTTTYKDTSAAADTAYTYRIVALDAAGNLSQPSATKSVTTPKSPTADTQAPTVPGSVTATPVSTSQINVKWNASTDNVAVARYHVYRSTVGVVTKVATVTTTSYGDTGLSANTSYTYYVTAEDAAGNVSGQSSTVSAKTKQHPTKKKGRITGQVSLSDGKRHSDTHVEIWVNGDKRQYHTDRRGNYSIPRLPAGTYRVKYSVHGNAYASQILSITVDESQIVTKNLSLKRK